jgi:hypothetical protein
MPLDSHGRDVPGILKIRLQEQRDQKLDPNLFAIGEVRVFREIFATLLVVLCCTRRVKQGVGESGLWEHVI